jgi:cytochrome b subunit of formate dehydrogenase
MDFVRRAANPWGEEVLLGLAWDVFWLVVVAGALFVVVHAVFKRKNGRSTRPPDLGAASGIPEKVVRHNLSARVSHWILAAATFTLLITAFVPIFGLQFPWVTIHWIAGLVFGAYVVYHTIDTIGRKSLASMWAGVQETVESIGRAKEFFREGGDPDERTPKWAFENKAFHQVTALAGLGVLGTGLLMFLRIDTYFWVANPYVLGLSDSLWGLVYLLHGLSAVGFVGLLIAHIYFAIRPDNLWITRSMFKGWITREEFFQHHDPAQWNVSENGQHVSTPVREEAAVGAGPGARHQGPE